MRHRDLVTRLIRIEDVLPVGCDHCRRWSGVVIAREDGSLLRERSCPMCGREVPVTLIRRYPGVDVEAV